MCKYYIDNRGKLKEINYIDYIMIIFEQERATLGLIDLVNR